MPDDDISYKILRHIQQTEQKSPTLTHIQHDFYIKLQAYLKELKDIVTNEPDPKKHALYTDEQKNTAKIGQAIYELREKKIVQAALSKVRGAQPDLSNLLDTEKILFDSLVDLITTQRTKIQETTHPTNSEKNPHHEQPPPKPTEETAQASPNTNPIIRITEDIPCFVGTNMQTYHLRKNDVLSLPPEMTKTLQKRKVATLVK